MYFLQIRDLYQKNLKSFTFMKMIKTCTYFGGFPYGEQNSLNAKNFAISVGGVYEIVAKDYDNEEALNEIYEKLIKYGYTTAVYQSFIEKLTPSA